MSRISYCTKKLYFPQSTQDVWRTLPTKPRMGGTESDLMLGGPVLACNVSLAPSPLHPYTPRLICFS